MVSLPVMGSHTDCLMASAIHGGRTVETESEVRDPPEGSRSSRRYF